MKLTITSKFRTNHSISVDCVLFGFDGKKLNVLLTQRERIVNDETRIEKKLPGRMIFDNESLEISAQKVVEEFTAIIKADMKQLHIFSNPQRVSGEELEWINAYHGINTDRVVTVAYYGLVILTPQIINATNIRGGFWSELDSIRHLIMDHTEILAKAVEVLCRDMANSPAAFDLLPHKFTVRQLQDLYSAVLGVEIDNRNFRKKILTSGLLTPTGEKEAQVAHKPAQYYIFNRTAYIREMRQRSKLGFISNWIY